VELVKREQDTIHLKHDGMDFTVSLTAVLYIYDVVGSYIDHAGETQKVFRNSVYGDQILKTLSRM
jgi:hypothetical protein